MNSRDVPNAVEAEEALLGSSLCEGAAAKHHTPATASATRLAEDVSARRAIMPPNMPVDTGTTGIYGGLASWSQTRLLSL